MLSVITGFLSSLFSYKNLLGSNVLQIFLSTSWSVINCSLQKFNTCNYLFNGKIAFREKAVLFF